MVLVESWLSVILRLLSLRASTPGDGVLKSQTIVPPTITPELSRYVEGMMEKFAVPGLSLGIIHSRDQIIEEYGHWGIRSEDGDEVTKKTLFSIGSCSKAFATAALGILMDDFSNGRNVTALPPSITKFSYDTKVHELFPGEDSDWKLVDKWASSKANLRDVLGHVSGLPRHDLSYTAADSPKDVVRRMRHLKPTFELRERFSYNNQMFILAAHIIATYSGKPYKTFVKERIFDPLGMSSTTFSAQEAERSGHFSQAFTTDNRRIPFWLADIEELITGAGGIISNTVDMNKWLAMLLNDGVDPRSNLTVVPKFAFDEVTTAHYIVSGKTDNPSFSVNGYGMGWARFSYKGFDVITHNGGLPGFLTTVAFVPSQRLGVVSFINTAIAPTVNSAVLYSILDRIAGSPPDSVPEAPRTVHPVVQGVPSTLSLEAFTGTYNDTGYGSIAFCSSASTSEYCKGVLSDFAAVYPDQPQHNRTLYAAWPRVWIRHVRLVHYDGNSFRLGGMTLFPNGHGRNHTPFAERPGEVDYVAEFDVKDGVVKGLAFYGGFAEDVEQPVQTGEGNLTEIADVYFRKV
ncbi:beta-lactamase/transpeptidase-like protein [Cristinia sonorae]|uniref:Beta-lactamase/transpeptidase-like protein n=1 Tax=Cristinia sonorae TaxID=1940300 RepID=A0A8K0UIC4_9AGAR|nr:beta-lactamase/transpeptidase-like protein [Cristinia sonorae]